MGVRHRHVRRYIAWCTAGCVVCISTQHICGDISTSHITSACIHAAGVPPLPGPAGGQVGVGSMHTQHIHTTRVMLLGCSTREHKMLVQMYNMLVHVLLPTSLRPGLCPGAGTWWLVVHTPHNNRIPGLLQNAQIKEFVVKWVVGHQHTTQHIQGPH